MTTSLEEYLSTSYSPDREYSDGRSVERNWGEKTHSSIQGNVFGWFWVRRKELPVRAFVEQRVQVSPTRFRIPDVTVVKTSKFQGEIFRKPAASLHRGAF
jgi:hypothetical protein